MRLMISNDRTRLICRVDYDNIERTKLTAATAVGATTIAVANANGLAANGFLLIGEPGDESAEVAKITSVTSLNVVVPALTFAHDNRTRVYKMDYDQVRFYSGPELQSTNRYASDTYGDANYTIIGTAVTLRPDYYTTLATTISTSASYCVEFYNSATAKAGPKGEKINGYEHLLCSPADLRKYDDLSTLGAKLLDKIDVSTWEIIPQFQNQDQDYADLDNRDILRSPAALLALHYAFAELVKVKDDNATLKADRYLQLYKDKLIEISQYINKTEQTVQLQGQSRCLR